VLGTRIGNYTLTAKLGEGGMGTVYLAEHAALRRRAAVKVLLPALSADDDAVARFFTEARAAAAVHHPSIVEIYDFGHLPDSSAYIVMELLQGESLAARRRRFGRLDVGRALALTRQLAGALAAAHDAGIVHRDLKPDNVFIVPDPEVPGGERIKILDFGVAKLVRGVSDASRTQTGAVLGTPIYISPEQCRNAAELDGRADLYSLGCVIYELVCGRPPFVLDSVGDLIAHHLYFEPPPPRTCGAEISESVEQLILWLLRKEPAARPGSARALIDAIDRLAPDVPDAAPSAPSASATHPAPRAALRDLAGGPGPWLPTPTPTPPPSRATSTTLTAASGTLSNRPASRRRGWRIAGVAAITILAGIAGFAALDGDHSAPAAATSAALPASDPAPGARSAEPSPAPGSDAPAAAPSTRPSEPSSPAPSEPPPTAPRSVHLALDTLPRGATVVVAGVAVGITPFTEDVPAGSKGRVYTLKKPGYEPVTATLETARDGSHQIELKKLPPPIRGFLDHAARADPGPGQRD
jgi:eukaryotic-like serine/threonine-protein kinase